MGKNFNPVDAHRKAQRAREVKKNKDARKDKKESQLVRKDTRDIEIEIKQLKSEGTLNDALKTRLGELEKELKHITTLKEKYVKDHPEAKDQIFKPRGERRQNDKRPVQDGDGDGDGNGQQDGGWKVPGSGSSRAGDPMGHLYDSRTGTYKDPKRSVYYDPTYNPFGAPPPGMPYRERSPEESEDDDDDDDDESDDEIIMPEGPPPGKDENGDSDSDDASDDSMDIPLPPGPPPPKPQTQLPPIHMTGNMPPPGYTGFAAPMQARPPFRPSGAGAGAGGGGGGGFRPPPGMLPPRPPAGGVTAYSAGPSMAGPSTHALPARPSVSGSTITQQPNIVRPPTTTGTSSGATATTAGMISAEPQLRDLRKEATAFVPRGIKRKKGVTTVNATPGSGEVDEQGDSVRVKRDDGPGLMGKLQSVLGAASRSEVGPSAKGSGGGEEDDDYQNFLKGLGDLA